MVASGAQLAAPRQQRQRQPLKNQLNWKNRRRSPSDARTASVHHQVPISHDDRYFFCAGVSRSMRMDMLDSFSRATSWSISFGTS